MLKHGTKPVHEAMVDTLIAHPATTPAQLAVMFGYTVEGVRIVMRTDAFREKLAERKGELVDPLLTAKVEDRLNALADLSIQKLLEKLNNPAPSDKLVLGAAELSTRALGYGARKDAPTVQNFIAVVPPTAPNAQAWAETYAPAVEVVEAQAAERRGMPVSEGMPMSERMPVSEGRDMPPALTDE